MKKIVTKEEHEISYGKCVVCGVETSCIDLGFGLMCFKDAKLLNDIANVMDKNTSGDNHPL